MRTTLVPTHRLSGEDRVSSGRWIHAARDGNGNHAARDGNGTVSGVVDDWTAAALDPDGGSSVDPGPVSPVTLLRPSVNVEKFTENRL